MQKIKLRFYFIVALLVMAQVTYMTYLFADVKQDYHSDEIWSYGLANSKEGPYIYMTDDQSENRNFGQWVSGDVLRDYVTVREGEGFDYGQVWYNLSMDMHPPLYFSILHTICSIFSGSYSLWYGFLINVAAFIIGQFFLFKTVRNLSGSDILAVAGCVLWGSSVAASSVTVFIRLYGLSAMWVIILMYFYSRMMLRMKFEFTKDILPIAIVTYLGAMTNHFFTAFAFCFTGAFCFYFLFTKRYKTLAVYAVSILAAVGLMFLCIPNASAKAATRVEASAVIQKANYDYQLVCCWLYMMVELFGIFAPVYGSVFLLYTTVGIGVVLFLMIPVLGIFRNEKWLHKLIKNGIILVKKAVVVTWDRLHRFPIMQVAMIVSITGIVLFTAYLIQIPLMWIFTDRYLSVVFPVMDIFVLTTLYGIIRLFVPGKKHGKASGILLAASVLIIIWNNLIYASPYLFLTNMVDEEYMTNTELSGLVSGQNCIVGYTAKWYMEMTPNYLYDVENMFAFATKDMEEDADRVVEELENIPDLARGLYLVTCVKEENSKMDTMEGLDVDDQRDMDKIIDMEDVNEMLKKVSYIGDIEYIGYTYSFGTKYLVYSVQTN